MNILVLNSGSSSLKVSLYQLATKDLSIDPIAPLWTGQIDRHSEQTTLKITTVTGRSIHTKTTGTNYTTDLQSLLNSLWQGETQVIANITEIDIVGHRVVHGGSQYHQPILINAQVQAEIDRLSIFAPLHNPASLMGIKAIEVLAPQLPQLAVFDTAFFGNLPAASYLYPLPYQWLEQGIRKYGFHGISHEYCADRAAQLLNRDLKDLRLISCHLGNGCSLAAIKSGICVDTTMGFTPLDGLMMGTRCGSIDPGIMLHLLREGKYTVAELDHVLNFESGLLGISGVSNDLREIDRAIELGNPRAKLALDLYTHLLTSKIAALLPELGGVDALIFTAGVGENHAGIRAAVAAKLAFLGVKIDLVLNISDVAGDQDLATRESSVRLLKIHTQEEWSIAKACWRYLTNIGIGHLTPVQKVLNSPDVLWE
jgi:acetate kinase